MAKVFNTTVKKRRVVQKVIVGGEGQRDVEFPDSIDFSEALAGVIGPIQTQDSTDISTALVVQELQLADSVLPLDDINAITTDLGDSFTTQTAAFVTILNADKLDSLDAADELRQIDLSVAESLNTDDAGFIPQLVATTPDSVSTDDAGFATLNIVNISDSKDISDLLRTIGLDVGESKDVSDLRGPAAVSATNWPNVVVQNTNFATPANLTDTNEATGATVTATQEQGLGGGASQTVNATITVSQPDPILIPEPTILTATLQWGWTTTEGNALLQNGNSVNALIEYSVNDGASWIALETVTNPAGTGNGTLNITTDYIGIQQMRFRATATVVSGTIAVVGGASQTFSFRYARCLFSLEQIL